MTGLPEGQSSLLKGRVVLITGSTRGIGCAIAEQCAAEGAHVAITGRTESRGAEVVDRISGRGGSAMFLKSDVTSEADIASMFDKTMTRWERVDGIVCNAANLDLGSLDGPVTEVTLDGWNKIITADLTSAFLTAKYGLKAMLRAGNGGSVLMIGSLAGIRGNIGHDAYSAAKGGMVSLSRAIAAYYARYKIRCNCLNLGFVDSGSDRVEQVLATPGFRDSLLNFHLGNHGRATDISGLAAFLLSDQARYINGAQIAVDGGASAASHMPRPTVKDLPGFPAPAPTTN
jgi:NAD(P)-dependent dehydrogenase (short-subunit alcohol dehydrogenase family)